MAAALLALTVDFGVYDALIRFGGVHYLVAAPIGFVLGLATIYVLSVRWVFGARRIGNAGVEFAIFAGIGLVGLALNQLVLYAAVEGARLSYEAAKVVSAGIVFCFNFGLRKTLLFTRVSDG
jgi:putative flippase GtrA